MQQFFDKAMELLVSAGGKIIVALLVLIIGRFIIKKIMKLLSNANVFSKADLTLRRFLLDFVKVLLYVILIVSIIGVLGIPMASVITVLASAGVAIGMSLQGALSNLAGGIMLMIFRPFNVNDYVEAGGAEGVVQEITLFYTIIKTLDNRRITVPNGTLMNANVTNYSSEALRRVDLTFSCAKGEDVGKIQETMLSVMHADSRILNAPEAPFARLSGGTNESMVFTVRAWTAGEKYWDVYFDLTQKITAALGEIGVKAPAVRVISENA